MISPQQYVSRVVRNASVLTNGYVAGYVMGVQRFDTNNTPITDQVDEFNFLALECDFTVGSLTNVAIKVEFSDDNTNWYIPTVSSFSGGVDSSVQAFFTLTLSGLYYINVNAELFKAAPWKAKYVRVSASGVGTVTSSSLRIVAMLGTA